MFDGANYTGNYQTYFGNKINTSSFSLIKSYIVQDSLVPYHNDYDKTIVPANENDEAGTIILSRYINLRVDDTGYDSAFYSIFRTKSDYTIGLTDNQSIIIPKEFYTTFFDDHQRSITF